MTLFRPGQPISVKARTGRQERRRIMAQQALLKKCIILINEYEVLIREYKLLLDDAEAWKIGKAAYRISLLDITEALKITLNCYKKIVDEFAHTKRHIASISKSPGSAYALVSDIFLELNNGYTNLYEQYERLQVNKHTTGGNQPETKTR
jgi:hypothetical protein